MFTSMPKRSCFKISSTVNVFAGPKHCWNLHDSSFILLYHHHETNWVGIRFSYSYRKFYDCFLTCWLQIKSIIIIIGRSSLNIFKCNYLNSQKKSFNFSLHFCNSNQFSNNLKKDKSQCLSISDIIYSEKRIYLNV